MPPEPDLSSDTDVPVAEGPSPWIPLGPAHLLFWAALVWPVVSGLVFGPAMRLFGPGAAVFSWGFTAVFWALGGGAILLGLKGQQDEHPGPLRRAAFMASLVIWLAHVAISLVLRFRHAAFGNIGYTYLRLDPLVAPFLAAAPLVLLMASREEQSGGTFDAAAAVLAMLGGLGFLGPFLLGFGALVGGHPLLAAAWDALRRPSEALRGEWFDGGDEAAQGRSLGQMALAFILSAPLLALLMVVSGRFGHGGFGMATQWIRPLAAWLTSLLLGIASLRALKRAGAREGRGLAIVALALCGLLCLPLLLLLVFLLLLATRVIRL